MSILRGKNCWYYTRILRIRNPPRPSGKTRRRFTRATKKIQKKARRPEKK